MLLAATALAGCGSSGSDSQMPPSAPTPGSTTDTPVTIASGLTSPVQAVPLPDGNTVWIVEQAGHVRRLTGGATDPAPVLDISARVRSGGEQGLLSVALHPKFPDEGRVYLHLSDPEGNTRVEEHRATSATIDPDPLRVLLEVEQPYANHNGGSLAFGPDGKLYLGLGDGGSANDPEGRSQDLTSRLGKLLRLDIDAPTPDWQIAAYGLRNPWRFSFDRQTGDAWIGDVGQGDWEEVDVFPKGAGLLNYGWDVYEGRDRAGKGNAADLGTSGTLTPPVAQYSHDEGCSITGGVVVRDPAMTDVLGRYLYGDYCSGTLWTVSATGDRTPRRETLTVPDLVSIDAGADGRVYLTSKGGTVIRLGPPG
jgi:glucose/arabinose dehydrogenase